MAVASAKRQLLMKALNPEEDRRVVEIARAIRRGPQRYLEAGQRLDAQFYSPGAFAGREALKLRQQLAGEAELPPGAAAARRKRWRDDRTARRQGGPNWRRSRLPLVDRLSGAVRQMLELAETGEARHLTSDQAARVLVLTWLMTDPEADQVTVEVSRFQRWPWNEVAEGLAEQRYGRRFVVEQQFYHFSGAEQRRTRWFELVERSWLRRPGAGEVEPMISRGNDHRPGATQVVVPPAERLALLRHADELDRHAEARDAAVLEDELGKEWDAEHVRPEPALGVRHLWLMLGRRMMGGIMVVEAETMEVSAPDGPVSHEWLVATPAIVLGEMQSAVERLIPLAPHLHQAAALRSTPGLSVAESFHHLREWLLQILGVETQALTELSSRREEVEATMLGLSRLSPDRLKWDTLGSGLKEALTLEREKVVAAANLGISPDSAVDHTVSTANKGVTCDDRTKTVIIDQLHYPISSQAAYEWAAGIIRSNGARYSHPHLKPSKMRKLLPPEVSALFSASIRGSGGGTALKSEFCA